MIWLLQLPPLMVGALTVIFFVALSLARQSAQGSELPISTPTSASIASMAKKIGTTPGS